MSACVRPDEKIVVEKEIITPDTLFEEEFLIPLDSQQLKKNEITAIEKSLIEAGLVAVQTLDSSIQVDLKYSTTDNFLGIDIYGAFNTAYLQKDVAEKLVKAQQLLQSEYPYYSLIIFDAVRPRRFQYLMWDTIQVSEVERPKYLSNPQYGSLHNYGAAVDISIINDKGRLLDMGTPYDYFGELAHPTKEEQFLASGELTYRQAENRKILRKVMKAAGFFNIQTEWWHFNSCYRKEARQLYKLIE